MKVKNGIYRHFKGYFYEVIGTGRHSESLEEYVIYKSLYDTKLYSKGSLWIRPLKMFKEFIVKDNRKFKRFRLINKITNK